MTRNPKPVVWNGIEYASINEAAAAMGITARALSHRIKRGYTCDADLEGVSGSPVAVTWDGIQYPSVAVAAKAIGVSKITMQKRLGKIYPSLDKRKPPQTRTLKASQLKPNED